MTATLTAPDGLVLQLRPGPAPAGPLRGTVLLVHGLGEHAGRYGHVMDRLAGEGWQTLAYDQRGHGRSPGPRGGIPSTEALLADLGTVVHHARHALPGPLLLLGHSLGGLLAGRYVAEGLSAAPAPWWHVVDGLVMSSPALDPGMNAFQKALLAVAAPLAPDAALGNGLKPAWVSRDPAVVRAYMADPLVHDRITPRLVRFIVDAGALVRARAAVAGAHAAAVRRRRPLRRAGRQRGLRRRGAAGGAARAALRRPGPRDLQRARAGPRAGRPGRLAGRAHAPGLTARRPRV